MRTLAAIVIALALSSCGEQSPRVAACTGASSIDFECLERRSSALAQTRGAAVALRDLAAERERNGYVRAACHQLTHSIGRAAGAMQGMRAFAVGGPMCSSGYYHGVVEAVMAKIGRTDAVTRAPQVCADLSTRRHHSADHYNCTHGVGHGFMGLLASDVFASLRGCDALRERWERRNCYGGVFMENLSAIGHAQRPSTTLRPHEPLYPCTVVAARYREPCLDKQTTYALYVSEGDVAKVFALCATVRGSFRRACDRGVGGDVAIDTVKHVFDPPARAAARREQCLLATGRRARADCVTGVVQVVLRDLTGGAAQTRAFCRSFGARDPLRRTCVAARAAAYRELPLQPGT